MKEKLLHTPEGVRDIYHSECKRKKALEAKLHDVLALYGYQDIETPAFEFFDIFNSDTGTVSSREMFKFFDRNNNTLVLRPDMTPSVARSVAKYYHDCTWPLRLSYVGNTFINNNTYQGKLAERTELGAEHINENSPEADAEAVVMMIDCFLAAGLKDFRIDIGQTAFYRAVMNSLKVPDEVKRRIHGLIENKNALGMELLLSDLELDGASRDILLAYNDLYGDVAMLDRALELTGRDPACRQAVIRLKEVHKTICSYGYGKYVGFDLGMVNYYDYYTGIIFRGYTYGTGDAIGKGGRYDNLLTQFGKKAPAIGFTILIDDLMMALSRQHIEVPLADYNYSVLIYKAEEAEAAISLARDLRRAGHKIELSLSPAEEDMSDYLGFLRFQGVGKAFILHDDSIETCFLNTGSDSGDTPRIIHNELSLARFKEEYGI